MQTTTPAARVTAPLDGAVALLADDGPVGRSFAAIVLGFAWVLTWRPQIDPDVWWHLAIGKLVVDGGGVPRTDPFSWMSADRPFVAHSWAWDVVLRQLYDVGGLTATSLLGAAVSAVIIGLMWALLRLIAPTVPPLARAAAVAVGVLAGLAAWSPRAQLIDLALVLACVLIWATYLRRGSVAPLAVIPILAIVWANAHGSGVLALPAGLVALAVATPIGVRWGTWPSRSPWPLIVSGLVGLAALAINPYGLSIPLYPFDPAVASAFHPAIDEWRSPDFNQVGLWTMRALLTGGLLAAVLGRGPRRDPLLLLLAAGWSFAALGSVRFVLIGGPLLAMALLPEIGGRRVPTPSLTSTRAPWATAAVVTLVLIVAGALEIAPANQAAEIGARFPVAMTDRLLAGGCTDRMLDAYDWGGYLAFRTGQRVGAYGSSPGDIVETETALENLTTDPAPFLDGQAVKIVLIKAGGPLDRWLAAADGWRSVSRDALAALYVRSSGVTCVR